jgi:hypothetical protein
VLGDTELHNDNNMTSLDHAPVVRIAIRDVRGANSPRLAGEDPAHVRLLAESELPLPPILVHRPTMRVIDGVHRLRAAVSREQETIEARFYEGDAAAAFVVGVQANVTHGLPLTLADRKAAALRILGSYPQWSDRAVAVAAGLSAKTVAVVRRRQMAGGGPEDARIGRDGRMRPLDSINGRLRAHELISRQPDAPVREIARLAGVSAGTAKDVRDRMRRGAGPLPSGRQGAGSGKSHQAPERVQVVDSAAILRELGTDPSVRFTNSGRLLLRSLSIQMVTSAILPDIVSTVPAHHIGTVAALARQCADSWRRLADELEHRGRDETNLNPLDGRDVG